MGLEIVIDIIESKVRDLEGKEENITDAIDKAQDYLSCIYMNANQNLRNKFSEYTTDYTKSYFFSKRDPSFNTLTDAVNSVKKTYEQTAVYAVRLGTFLTSYCTLNQFIDTQSILFLANIFASAGIGFVSGKIESKTHYLANKFFKITNMNNYYGTKGYNKKLRKKLTTEITRYEKTYNESTPATK